MTSLGCNMDTFSTSIDPCELEDFAWLYRVHPYRGTFHMAAEVSQQGLAGEPLIVVDLLLRVAFHSSF